MTALTCMSLVLARWLHVGQNQCERYPDADKESGVTRSAPSRSAYEQYANFQTGLPCRVDSAATQRRYAGAALEGGGYVTGGPQLVSRSSDRAAK
ncbi:hypothetical protein C8F01DRAFT_698274 [Mycena amicta]|nr:hypothetical protein C8F01DRAFT_698274 [Mycena amicta]